VTRSPLASIAPFGGCRFGTLENLISVRTVGSTNEVGREIAAKMLAEDNEILPTAIVAERQEGGRGRSGRRWESPEGSLAVSLLLPWPEGPQRVRLPMEIAIPLARSLSEAFGVEVRLKWPNDLVVGGRKLGGILIETRISDEGEGAAVVGVGLNATTSRESLDGLGLPGATSLAAAGAPAAALSGDRAVLALLAALDAAVASETDVAAEFAAVSAHAIGEPIAVHDGPRRVEGTFQGVTADGFLRLQTPMGEEIVLSGEVESF
jgi:BirA family transcriptional regulator, biotin operon repressor / biotin---[acetyl-CoA-carboxylase] ligase